MKAALGGMNLLLLSSEINVDSNLNKEDGSKFDSNAKEALDYLS